MTSHRSIPSGIIAFAIFAVAAGADASTVSNQRIEEVAPHITDVLLCKVTDANHFHEHMKLKDGNEGPAISVVAEYKVEVTEVLAGSWKRTDAPVVVRWSLRYPIVYDGNGVVTMTFSYIVPWSGIEVGLKKDQQYILCFHPIRAEDKILTLVRAEPVERKQAVIDALAWVKAWASLKKHLGDGTARITLMAFDKAGGRLAVLVRDEPDQRLFVVDVATGTIRRREDLGQFKANQLYFDGEIVVFRWNDEKPGAFKVSDMKPLEFPSTQTAPAK